MANKDPNGSVQYVLDGASSTIIKSKTTTPIKSQVYWYNGQPQGFLDKTQFNPKPRNFAILLGF